jgi:hypothetical protein
MKYLLLLLLLTLNINAQTSTAYTPIVGYNTIHMEGGVNFINSPFINQPIYSGNGLVNGSTITINSPITIDSSQPYYVELSDGSIFDIVSYSNGIINVLNLPSILQGQTISISIRHHVTLGEIVKNSTGFSDYSDALSTPNGDGCVSYIYISNGVVEGDYATPADNTILYPDEKLIINNSYNISVTFFGELAFADNIVN